MGPTKKSSPATRAAVDSEGLAESPAVRAALKLFACIELGEQVRVMLETAVEWTGASCAVGVALGEDGRTFVPVAGTVPDEDPRYTAFTPVRADKIRPHVPEELAVFREFGPLTSAAARWPGDPPPWCAVLPAASPEGRWAGVVFLLLDAEPDPGVAERLRQLLRITRPAFRNGLQVRSMQELVIKDDTASCFNRRHFEEFLPEELSRASRFRAPVSLIFLDMDNLKQVNIQHGHANGSRTLYEVSWRVRRKVRKFDKLFRYGGDEFCIVLPETEWHGAMEVAQRVRDAIVSKPFLVNELGDPAGVPMTASLGIASFPLHARTQKAMIQLADRAMQKVKAEGKDAIGVAEIAGGDDGG